MRFASYSLELGNFHFLANPDFQKGFNTNL